MSNSQDEASIIKEAILDVAQAMREGNAMYGRAKHSLPVTEEQVWALVEGLNFEELMLSDAYLHLIPNPGKLRAVLGCPWEKRKQMITRLVFGNSGPSS